VPFVTTLTLRSGDRAVLERVVGDIKRRAERKGVELKGPHAETPADRTVPQAKRCDAAGPRFPPWRYDVYIRRLEVVGHDGFARSVAEEPFPEGIHLDVEVERVSAPDGR
jgi:ribosomal protein S10